MKKIILILLIFLGFYLNFLPHLNYDYPLHVDEWVHFTYSQHISDNSPLYFGGESNSLEHGFHLLLSVLNLIGIPYLLMFKFFASFLFVLILLAVFILVRKYFDEKTALFSVLFMILLKSSVQLLGPMFFVPMAIGMFLIPISLFLADTKILFLIIAGCLIIHPPSAIAMLILLGCYSLLNLNKLKHMFIHGVIGIAISLPLFIEQMMKKGLSNLIFNESLINVLFIPRYLGYLITGLIIIGIFVVLHRKKYLFFLYPVILLILSVLYYNFGINLLIMYERNLMFLFLSFSILFGAGCILIGDLFKKYKNLVYIGLIILLLVFVLPAKISSSKNVYHLTDDKDYNNFINLDKNGVVLIDPYKAIAFTPLAKMQVYTRIVQGRNETYAQMNKEVFEYFKNNCTDKNFLRDKNISYVYGCSSNI